MSKQSLGTRVQSELQQAVDSGLLPESIHKKAEDILTHLQKPVRLALMGMPESGKSSLMNLLVANDVIPKGVSLPTLQLLYGETEQATCTLPDGSKKVFGTVDPAAIAALSPVFVELRMPLAALKKISILEVVAPEDSNAIHRASQWAAKRTDVALWCTRGYSQEEQRIWSAMPYTIKDHAFCLVTHADFLKSGGMFEAAVGAITTAASDDFKHVLAISAPQAISARRADGTVDKETMRESGGSALISAVLKEVERGRQAAVDSGDVLLHQHADVIANIKAQAAATVSDVDVGEAEPEAIAEASPEPEQPTEAAVEDVIVEALEPDLPEEPPVEEPVPAPAAKPAARDAISRLRELAARKNMSRDAAAAPAPKPAEPEPEPVVAAEPEPVPEPTEESTSVDAEVLPLQPETREAYEHVIETIEECGADLVVAMEEHGDKAPAEVIALTVAHIRWLCDYLNENGDDTDPFMKRARDTAYDAADMAQLMELEKRDSAALEAVTLLLQIKRELQADLAA